MNNKIDRKIKKALIKNTEHIEKQKNKTWENIHNELFLERIIKRRKRRKIAVIVAMAAIVMFVWVSFSTTTGQALVQEFKDLFVSEKDVELEIEGDKEDTHVELEANEELRYVIYIDATRYKLVKSESGDIISPEPELGDDYPETSMTINRVEDKSRQEAIEAIKQDIAQKRMILKAEEDVNLPVDATSMLAIGSSEEEGEMGYEWDTPIVQYYVTKDEQGQFFIIEQKYFLEASEGHGVRFDSMLESFEMVREN